MEWDHLHTVLEIVRGGSLSAAARVLGVNQTTVARRLSALEAQMGTPLLSRIGKEMVPTPAGALVAKRAHQMEIEARAAFAAVRETREHVEGTVRLTTVGALSTAFLAPRITILRSRHPGLILELGTTNANLSLTRREADIAVRLARPEGEGLVIRKLADIGFAVYGPSSIAPTATGTPWLTYDESFSHLPEARWQASRLGKDGIALRATSADVLMVAARNGLGKAVLPCFLGDSEPALARWEETGVSREVWMAVHQDVRRVPAVRAVLDWLGEVFTAGRDLLAGTSTSGDG